MERCAQDKEWRLVVEGARKVFLGAEKPVEPKDQVRDEATYAVELEQSFVACSKKDLRQMSGLARLPRIPLKNVPSLVVPGHIAGNDGETYYLFRDDSEPYKKARVRMTMGQKLEHGHLVPDNFLWRGQGEACVAHHIQQSSKASGLADALARESNMMNVEQFVKEKLCPREKVDAQAEGEPQQEEEAALEACSLVGPAAAAAQQQQQQTDTLRTTPPAKGKKDHSRSPANVVAGIARSASSASLMGLAAEASEPGDGGSEHPASSGVSGLLASEQSGSQVTMLASDTRSD